MKVRIPTYLISSDDLCNKQLTLGPYSSITPKKTSANFWQFDNMTPSDLTLFLYGLGYDTINNLKYDPTEAYHGIRIGRRYAEYFPFLQTF